MTIEGESECDSLLSERAKSSFALFTPLRSVLLSPHPPKKNRGAHITPSDPGRREPYKVGREPYRVGREPYRVGQNSGAAD